MPPARLESVEGRYWRSFREDRIRQTRTPVVYWDFAARAWTPATVTGWVQSSVWYVRLRVRYDGRRDTITWYYFDAKLILPLKLDEQDAAAWMPERPF